MCLKNIPFYYFNIKKILNKMYKKNVKNTFTRLGAINTLSVLN